MKAMLNYLFTFLLLFAGCKKEDEYPIAVLAGMVDDRMLYQELNPALAIPLKSDTLLQVATGADSLDLDQDGSFDVIISQRIPLDGNYNKRTVNDTYPFCKLRFNNGVEAAYEKETYYIGLGQTSSINWIDTIAYKENLAEITTWSESNIHLFMWAVPPTIFWGSDGTWYNLVNSERYIAIRKYISSRYCYGWIKVKAISREHLSFISFAMEKP